MADALKAIYTNQFFTHFTQEVETLVSTFDSLNFVKDVTGDDWEDLTVRTRMKKIAGSLGTFLPGSYEEQLAILLTLHSQNRGFAYLFFPDFIGIYGLDKANFELSLDYLKKMTPFSSAEFAIREFIRADPEAVLALLVEWSTDPDEHVRRLASEGARPLLPWGGHLAYLIPQPELVLPILTNLRADPSLYVRKSVANHLNDISKNHPAFVIETCREWLGHGTETDWIIKRACRTLIKKADPHALSLFGYQAPGTTFTVRSATLSMNEQAISIGDKTAFNYAIITSLREETPIRLEYGIDYVKANGTTSLKKFYLAESVATNQHLTGKKSLDFKNLTTRKHYPGKHRLRLFLNGHAIAETEFDLSEPT